MDVSGDSEAMLSFFSCSKFSVQDYNTSDVPTGQTFAINSQLIETTTIMSVHIILSV